MNYFTQLIKIALFAMLSLSLFSCDEGDTTPIGANPIEIAHFDIWVSIGDDGMGLEDMLLVQSTIDLDDSTVLIDYKGVGVDVTSKLFQHSMIKGQYYYQMPQEKDRFGKYRIGSTGIEVDSEISFDENSYKDRRYAHAFIDDTTFVVLAANGDKDSVIWTKFNAKDMSIISEGSLSGLDADLEKFSTSGLADYRTADNTILYSYCHSSSSSRDRVYMAFIDATTMEVKANVQDNRVAFMAGTAYGQLLQSKAFFDTNGDYYLACNTKVDDGNTSSTEQFGALLRINAGEEDFDRSYEGFITPSKGQGKLVTVESLETGRALVYVQDPEYTEAGEWGSYYNCYYAILDLVADELTILDIPYSEGTFSQRSVVLGDKAYIGVNPESTSPCVYVYDINDDTLVKGLSIAEGYSFDRIVALDDAE